MSSIEKVFDVEIEKLLSKIADDEQLSEYEIKRAPGSMKGDGYLGIITAIEMTGKKLLNLVVKSASKSDALRVDTPVAEVFKREIYMYNNVIPTLQNFQIRKCLPVLSSFAKCYSATIIDKSEALIMENLKTAGFKLWERRVPMNDAHVSLVMKEYGRFHALSFALKDQEPERFAKLTNPMGDVFDKFLKKSEFANMFIKQCYKAAEALDPVEEAEVLKVFTEFVDNCGTFISSLPELVDHYSVILHGDCWTNNMMFGYDDHKHPNTPTKIRFIDLQLARLGPPVLDLSYFFYSCSSKDVISKLQEYMDIYYQSLASCLKELGSDPEKVYPYSVFRRQWKESARFGLLMSMLLIKIMLSEQNEVTDLADAAEAGQGITEAFGYDIANNDAYKERTKHVILHFVNNRFI